MTGHHHDDLGGSGRGVKQQSQGEQHQHQPAFGIGWAKKTQDPIAPAKKHHEDQQRKGESCRRAHRRDGLGLAHLAGMKMLGDHGRDHQFDGKGKQGHQAGGTERVEVKARTFKVQHQPDQDHIGIEGSGFDQGAKQEPAADSPPLPPIWRGDADNRAQDIVAAHGRPELHGQGTRQQCRREHEGIGTAEHDANAEQGNHRGWQGDAPENVAWQQRRPQRALRPQGRRIIFGKRHRQDQESGAIEVVCGVGDGQVQHPQPDEQAQRQRNGQPGQHRQNRAGLDRRNCSSLAAGDDLLRPEPENGGRLTNARGDGQHGCQGHAEGKVAIFVHRHRA